MEPAALQNPPPKRIEIARFPGNKRFAVTTSWDDGTVEDRRLVAFMNEYGLKGTFNLNSAFLKTAGTPAAEGSLDRGEVDLLARAAINDPQRPQNLRHPRYCANIGLFDYEAARTRIVIAAKKRVAFNPSGLTVTLLGDGKAVGVSGGATVPLA